MKDEFQINIICNGTCITVDLIDYQTKSKTTLNNYELNGEVGSIAWMIRKLVEQLKPLFRTEVS